MTAARNAPAPPADGPNIYTRADVAMDTLVTLRVDTGQPGAAVESALARALQWFATVEATCSRFDERSELVELASRPGVAVPVSPLLLEATAFALELARLTAGRFDPTIGAAQRRRGFDRHYISARHGVATALALNEAAGYRDVRVDRAAGTIVLRRPLLLDLGAVAKGLAIDLAARELSTFERYAVDAGGDLYAGGAGAATPWRIGIRDPQVEHGLLGTVGVMNAAVCTSGGYERPGRSVGEHHLLDPRTGHSPRGVAGVTVLAPTAMVADALATAAFVLGPVAGLRLLADQGVEGLLATSTGELRTTPGFAEHYV